MPEVSETHHQYIQKRRRLDSGQKWRSLHHPIFYDDNSYCSRAMPLTMFASPSASDNLTHIVVSPLLVRSRLRPHLAICFHNKDHRKTSFLMRPSQNTYYFNRLQSSQGADSECVLCTPQAIRVVRPDTTMYYD